MVKRKVSLGGAAAPKKRAVAAPLEPSETVLELFFNTGIVFHEVPLTAPLPDVVSSFVVVKDEGARAGLSMRRAAADEEPDVELSALDHLPELANRWLPFPYQLSCAHAVQVWLAAGESPRILLAIDTTAADDSKGRALDIARDGGRPFRPLSLAEASGFFDHAATRELLRKLEKGGMDRAPFKLAALVETIAALLPRLRLTAVDAHTPIDVSMVLDLGNSRSSAMLVESRDGQVMSVPIEVRNMSNPFEVTSGTISSRITFHPSPFESSIHNVAVGDAFREPSIARMGREALDRALETPHRYSCSLSGPKRYLWDGAPTDQPWCFALKQGGEFGPIAGRILKYIDDESGGLALREDGPSTPADPRYAPRTMMLFAIVELVSQAMSQINAPAYRVFQGKELSPRVLRHLVITYPSGMRPEERAVYETLVRNAVTLCSYLYNIEEERRPNFNAQKGVHDPFLLVDEALAAQMVYVYEEVVHAFSGNMAELVRVYSRDGKALRVASVDIGGGTCDVMIAEYTDKLPGTGTALSINKLFQDGVSVAGDDVCRAIVEDIIFEQVLQQLPSAAARSQLMQLFSEDGGTHGAAWRTLKAKLVPYFWLPLSRCYWALGEGFAIPEHTGERLYNVTEVFEMFEESTWSSRVLEEADELISRVVREWPGFTNLFFRFDVADVEAAVDRVLREPLRRYADIVAQFDIDVLVLAGRTSALERVHDLFVAEMPVASPRIKTMANYRVSDWYPAAWRHHGVIKDPKSTVTAGATILHLAGRNRLPGLLLEEVIELDQKPIYGLYQLAEPHIRRDNELFRAPEPGGMSPPFAYTGGMRVGFRNVDSEEMDGTPLFEVRPANADVEAALLEERVSLQFRLEGEAIEIARVVSQRGQHKFEPDDFSLVLKTTTTDRYWLDTGLLRGNRRYLEETDDEAFA